MIKVRDKYFEVSISSEQIAERVKAVGAAINADYEGKTPVMISVLNGSFVFAADLVRELNFQPELVFTRFASYSGTQSTGKIRELIGLDIDLEGRDVIIIEDIIDSGFTMSKLVKKFKDMGANRVDIAVLLMKPENLKVELDVKYCAMEIPADFIVGYGLDYDGFGRNFKDIYTVVDNPE